MLNSQYGHQLGDDDFYNSSDFEGYPSSNPYKAAQDKRIADKKAADRLAAETKRIKSQKSDNDDDLLLIAIIYTDTDPATSTMTPPVSSAVMSHNLSPDLTQNQQYPQNVVAPNVPKTNIENVNHPNVVGQIPVIGTSLQNEQYSPGLGQNLQGTGTSYQRDSAIEPNIIEPNSNPNNFTNLGNRNDQTNRNYLSNENASTHQDALANPNGINVPLTDVSPANSGVPQVPSCHIDTFHDEEMNHMGAVNLDSLNKQKEEDARIRAEQAAQKNKNINNS